MSEIFAEYARYYDLLYQDKDYAGETDYVAQLISRWQGQAKTILEFGSGTGRHALCLAKRGYAVCGIDRSSAMLVQAKALSAAHRQTLESEGLTAPEFIQDDMRTARLNRGFDVALSLFHALGYQTKNEDLQATFRTAREHLREGGLFLFDAWYGPAVLTDRPAARVKRTSNDRVECVRFAQPTLFPGRNMVQVNYRLLIREKRAGFKKEIIETHPMRYVFEPEVAALAQDCGFELLLSEEWLTHRPLGCRTWHACFILRRLPAEAA